MNTLLQNYDAISVFKRIIWLYEIVLRIYHYMLAYVLNIVKIFNNIQTIMTDLWERERERLREDYAIYLFLCLATFAALSALRRLSNASSALYRMLCYCPRAFFQLMPYHVTTQSVPYQAWKSKGTVSLLYSFLYT